MVAEVKVVQHVDDVVRVIHVLLPQLIQNAHLDQGLLVEPLLIPDDLDGHVLVRLVIERPHHLPKAALADQLENLVAIRDVVMDDLVVAAVLVVVTAVEYRARLAVDLERVQAQVPDLRVLFNLRLLVVGHAVSVQFDGLCAGVKEERKGALTKGFYFYRSRKTPSFH